jgi:hypothetical protein
MLDTWTIAAGFAAGAGLLMAQVKEEISNSIIRNARTRARTILGIGRSKMEAAPCAGTQEPPVGRGELLPMKYSPIHCPAPPVYEIMPSNDGITHIRVPDTSLEKATKSRLNRRNRALLAAAAKRGEVDLSKWSIASLAELFGASPRSVAEASKLTSQELQDVANERRPLFPSRTSIPDPSLTPTQHLRAAIDGLGIDEVRAALSLSPGSIDWSGINGAVDEDDEDDEADITDVIEEAA